MEPPGLEPGSLCVKDSVLPDKLWPRLAKLTKYKAGTIKFR